LEFGDRTYIGENISTNSLTATGLTVDTDTLYVDGTNDRVGVGTDSPSVKLEVNGDAKVLGDLTPIFIAGISGQFRIKASQTILGYGENSALLWFNDGNANDWKILVDGGNMIFSEESTEWVRFASGGNIGIGTTDPSQELDLIGSLELENTTSDDTGVIYKGADRFIHDYTASGTSGQNVFIGKNSGNFTMSGTGSEASHNVGIGQYTLTYITTGKYNMAMGSTALNRTTSGTYNTGIGYTALRWNQTGDNNVAIGGESGSGVPENSFSNNTLIGYRSGYALQTNANNNVLLGYQAGNSITTGTDNIIIGYDEDTPAVDTSNHLNIGGLIYGDLSGGKVGIGTATPTEKLDVDSDTIRLRTAKTPASATAVCDQGEIVWDANYVYICVATNSWKRSAIAAW